MHLDSHYDVSLLQSSDSHLNVASFIPHECMASWSPDNICHRNQQHIGMVPAWKGRHGVLAGKTV